MKYVIVLTVLFTFVSCGAVCADSLSLNIDDLIVSEVMIGAIYRNVLAVGDGMGLSGTTVFDFPLASMTTSSFDYTYSSGSLPGYTWNTTGERDGEDENYWFVNPIGAYQEPEVDPDIPWISIEEIENGPTIILHCTNLLDGQDGWTVTWSSNGSFASSSHTSGATDMVRILEDDEGLYYDIEINSDKVYGNVVIEMNGTMHTGTGQVTYTSVPEPSGILAVCAGFVSIATFYRKRKAG
ncbi:PEP-CTERM sorting domain-containing protein [bacterium]|nr:PEP-CTERM sorting domain-containing protein [bacterium]